MLHNFIQCENIIFLSGNCRNKYFVSEAWKWVVVSWTWIYSLWFILELSSATCAKIFGCVSFHILYLSLTETAIHVEDVIFITLNLHDPGPIRWLCVLYDLWGWPKLIDLVFLYLELAYRPFGAISGTWYWPGPGTLFFIEFYVYPGSFILSEYDFPLSSRRL